MTEGPSRPQPLIFSEAAVSCERLEGRALGPGGGAPVPPPPAQGLGVPGRSSSSELRLSGLRVPVQEPP